MNKLLLILINLFFILLFNIELYPYSPNFKFPKDFKFGATISEYQNSGAENCPNCQWADWENKIDVHSCKSCNFWNLYPHDIKRMKQFGLNSFRFSVSWSKIEPQQNIFNQKALDHYVNLCDKLLQAGIEPMVTLHHFAHPKWFEKLGAFEKEENIKYFIRFSKKVFEKLSSKVKLWCPINEPGIYMFQGYLRGVFPPGKKWNIKLALKVLKNLLNAHVQVYETLKQLPNGNRSQIGFVHQYLKFQPYHWWNLIEKIPVNFLNYLLNSIILYFCKTGEFTLSPQSRVYKSRSVQNKKIFDFIGLNYYSRVLLKFQLNFNKPFISAAYEDEIMTDMPYAIYAQGLYDAIKEISKIGAPIYITENGIADAKDNKREIFLKQYLTKLKQAIKDGYNIKGYYYWTLTDNFEWDNGFKMKFGLYSVDFSTQKRALRKGSTYYKNFIKQNS